MKLEEIRSTTHIGYPEVINHQDEMGGVIQSRAAICAYAGGGVLLERVEKFETREEMVASNNAWFQENLKTYEKKDD